MKNIGRIKYYEKYYEYQRKWQREAYSKRKESGICVKCGKRPATENKTMCEDCLRKASEYSKQYKKETRDLRRILGLCIQCGVNKSMPNRDSCYECLYKSQVKGIYRKVSVESAERNRKRQVELRNERKNSGLCPECGRERSDKRYVLCLECRLKQRRRYYDNACKTRNYYSLVDGACRFCGRPVVHGKKYCKEHYQDAVKRANHATQMRKASIQISDGSA